MVLNGLKNFFCFCCFLDLFLCYVFDFLSPPFFVWIKSYLVILILICDHIRFGIKKGKKKCLSKISRFFFLDVRKRRRGSMR